MDNGFPQITSADLLQEYIKTSNVHSTLKSAFIKLRNRASSTDSCSSLTSSTINNIKNASEITQAITGKMDWRPLSKYIYPKNEVYLDVLESIDLLMSRNGSVLQMCCIGKLVMRTALSGMPEARIGINDKLCLDIKQLNTSKSTTFINLNDVKLHRCVRLGKFEEDRSILFVPPDGEFQLMRYNVSNIILPFHVYPNVIERGGTRIEYEIKIEALFNATMFSGDVIIYIPCPKNTSRCTFKTNIGKIKYEPTEAAMVWKFSFVCTH